MLTKGNKNSLEFIKELVTLVKKNSLASIEVNQSSKEAENISIKISNESTIIGTTLPSTSKSTSKDIIESADDQIDKNPQTVENSEPENHPGMVPSPMVGTVYLSPEPGAEPYVKVGDTVKVGQTILIVEAMKTLNQIPSAKNGVVTRIFVDDGSPVEFGSPLAIIE